MFHWFIGDFKGLQELPWGSEAFQEISEKYYRVSNHLNGVLLCFKGSEGILGAYSGV